MKKKNAMKSCGFSRSEKRSSSSSWSQLPKNRRTRAARKFSHAVLACLLILATVFLYATPQAVLAADSEVDTQTSVTQVTTNDTVTENPDIEKSGDTSQENEPAVSEDQGDVTSSQEPATKAKAKSKAPAAKSADEEEAQVPSVASEDDEVVCKIGSKGYSSLKEAVADAKDGDTIVMVADETQTETIVIPAGKSLTIKDDGKKRTVTAGDKTLFKVEGTLAIDGSNLVLDGGKATDTNIADVTGTLNMKSGTVNGGTYETLRGVIYAHDSGTFNLSGGAIQNCKGENNQFSGVVRITDSATMNMTGGEICNNDCYVGSGICVIGSMGAVETYPIVNISGGSIHDNSGLCGTAIMAPYHGVVKISGGEIYGNTDNEFGVEDSPNAKAQSGTIFLSKSELTMTGGVIRDNKARNGGAIYAIRETKINITGGTFTGNRAQTYGGAIFLDDSLPSTYIENGVVSGNTASSLGGGVWCCPTGTAKICATEGLSIFDNTANDAGDDFTNLRTDNQQFAVELSERMLGGGLENYYVDGGLMLTGTPKDAEYWHGTVDTSVPRYGEVFEKFDITTSGDGCLALKAVPTEGAKESANKHAKVVISGNTAAYGGGIACNGSLFSGKTDEEPDVWSLKVNKVWNDVAEEEQTEVEIALIIDGVEVDSVKLNKDNNWEAEFKDLPDPETLNGKIEVVEKTKGFAVEYSEITTEGTTMSVTVTNSPEPEIDEPPVPEDEPPTPDTKDEPEKPTYENPKTPESPASSKETKTTTTKHVAKTGDDRGYTLYIVLGVLALGAAVAAVAVRRRNIK